VLRLAAGIVLFGRSPEGTCMLSKGRGCDGVNEKSGGRFAEASVPLDDFEGLKVAAFDGALKNEDASFTGSFVGSLCGGFVNAEEPSVWCMLG